MPRISTTVVFNLFLKMRTFDLNIRMRRNFFGIEAHSEIYIYYKVKLVIV